MLSKVQVFEALKAANEAPYERATISGCGRAYVVASGDKAEVTAFAAAAKKLGLKFMRKAYGTSGPALYVGYDNADGKALGKARKMVEVLKSHGVSAYDDAVGD